jgi:hypothetical protein
MPPGDKPATIIINICGETNKNEIETIRNTGKTYIK